MRMLKKIPPDPILGKVERRMCGLVANHSAAQVEARRRAIEIEWADERTPLRDALWWAGMTITPTRGHNQR
ncbi:hypothetical protein [Nocardia sp. NPDC050710]|uniref:hypothetical protein n=1 Tax=Nocardia sp. NPDC050710 TaxID=3157220 RepID=UPI0033D3C8FE